jgi:hypothetical protein
MQNSIAATAAMENTGVMSLVMRAHTTTTPSFVTHHLSPLYFCHFVATIDRRFASKGAEPPQTAALKYR